MSIKGGITSSEGDALSSETLIEMGRGIADDVDLFEGDSLSSIGSC